MSLTVRELLTGRTRGLEVNYNTYESQYFEDQVIPQDIDLTDLMDRKLEIISQKQELDLQLKDLGKAELRVKDGKPVQVPDTTPPDLSLPKDPLPPVVTPDDPA